MATNLTFSENAASRKKVLELQDAGKYDAAAQVLQSQAADDAIAGAALDNTRLTNEAKDLGAVSDQMKAAQPLSNLQRKAFHYENYNQANQKEEQ